MWEAFSDSVPALEVSVFQCRAYIRSLPIHLPKLSSECSFSFVV